MIEMRSGNCKVTVHCAAGQRWNRRKLCVFKAVTGADASSREYGFDPSYYDFGNLTVDGHGYVLVLNENLKSLGD